MDYAKALLVCLLALAGLKFGLPLIAIPPSYWQGGMSPNLAWYGDAFLAGETPILEATHIHNTCYPQAEAGSDYRSGTLNPRVTIYVRCWGRALAARPQYLCDDAMKRHYLRLIGDYKREIEFYWQKGADVSQIATSELRRTAAPAPGASAAISGEDLDEINLLVRTGTVEPAADLAPLIDIAQLVENPTAEESAAARKETCQ